MIVIVKKLAAVLLLACTVIGTSGNTLRPAGLTHLSSDFLGGGKGGGNCGPLFSASIDGPARPGQDSKVRVRFSEDGGVHLIDPRTTPCQVEIIDPAGSWALVSDRKYTPVKDYQEWYVYVRLKQSATGNASLRVQGWSTIDNQEVVRPAPPVAIVQPGRTNLMAKPGEVVALNIDPWRVHVDDPVTLHIFIKPSSERVELTLKAENADSWTGFPTRISVTPGSSYIPVRLIPSRRSEDQVKGSTLYVNGWPARVRVE